VNFPPEKIAVPYNKTRDWQIGFDATVAPRAIATMQRLPRYAFRGEKVYATTGNVQADKAVFVVGFYVGQKVQFPPNRREVSIANFSSPPLGSGMKCDLCEKGEAITIIVENRSTEQQDVRITLFGRARTD
jgi:hypothetical protein